MSEQISTDLIVNAVSRGFDQLASQVGNAAKSGEKLEKSFKVAGMSLTDLRSGFLMAGQIAGQVKQVMDETFGAYQGYADQVRQLTVDIGATPQEASKLIQVADDMGVEFSQLETALQGAIRKGVNPTIDGIGKLSDAYLQLAPGVERTKFLMDNFGRSGADIARLMELGSGKIREMGDSIEGTALLMDQGALQAAEEYRRSLDDLNDSMTNLKYTLANWATPGASGFMDWLNELIKGSADADDAADLINAVFQGTFLESQTSRIRNQADALGDWGGKEDFVAIKARELAGAMGEGESRLMTYGEAFDRMRTNAALEEFAAQVVTAGEAAETAASGIGALIDQTNRDVGSAISDMLKDMEWLMAGGGEIEQGFAAVKEAWQNDKITDAEAKTMLEGLYTESTNLQLELDEIDASTAAQNIADTLGVKLSEAWDIVKQLQSNTYFKYTVDVVYNTIGTSPKGGNSSFDVPADPKNNFASGVENFVVPPGYPNDTYTVGLTSGERLDVTPAGGIAAGSGGGPLVGVLTVNVTEPGASPMEVAGMVLAQLNRAARSRGGLGYAGR